MRRQYDQVGRAIEQLKVKQEGLNASIARGATLKNQRSELRGQAMETLGTAAVVGAPIVQSLRTAIDFKDQTRDIAITGGFDETEEKGLSDVMRGAALKWNQTQTEVAKGTGVLIAGGISSAKELAAYAPVMAKTATATRASMDDLGSVAIALNDNLGIGADGLARAMNMLAYAGKRGQFELADMAKWLPQLTPQFAALGITGERAVAEIGASLQIARKGAGSNDEAANNFKNFLSKLTSPDTLKAFNDAGINIKQSLANMVKKGLTPTQAMLEVVTNYMGTKGPAAAEQFQKVMSIKDDKERETALNRLNEAYKLGELFRDQQALSYIRPALANRAEQADIQKESLTAADQGILDQDWQKRMGSPKEQLKALTISLSEVGIALGGALLPSIVEITQAIVPVVRSFAVWAEANPGLVSGVVKAVASIVALKLAFIGVKYGANLGLSALNSAGTMMSLLSAKTTLLNSSMLATRFGPLISGVSGLTAVLPGLTGMTAAFGATLAATPIGWIIAGIAAVVVAGLLIYKYWEPIKAWVTGFFSGFVEGIKPIREAFSAAFEPLAPLFSALGDLIKPIIKWFGELFSPVKLTGDELGRATSSGAEFGRVVGAVFSALFTPARWLLELIAEIPKAFSGGLSGVASLIINFSPTGLFYKAFAGVMSYFGIELPGKFTEFGSMLITGLVNGITNMAGSLKDSVIGVGSSVKGWFTETLGIQSPSRVFIGYGANISEGAAIGISSQAGLVRNAALGMAAQSKVDLLPPDPAAVSRASMMGNGGGASPGVAPGADGPPTFHYSPQINVPGGPGVRDQVGQALQAGYADFVRFMERYEYDKQRRSYGPAGGGSA
ncbi:phage tail tape measure protein [Pseudomonas protegens]|uniref:phage tail tape measure protein n=1 Tax=Pseudomonas protegens TaxID=380021 RepID=UPI00287D7308|nr:phage tail tape measure protein [Pseudomonas protegens]MDS9879369.1 phage tail tape measure protein [Pseudomonas protegens]